MTLYVVEFVKTKEAFGRRPLPLGFYRSLSAVVESDDPETAFKRAETQLLIEPEFYEGGKTRVYVIKQEELLEYYLKELDPRSDIDKSEIQRA